MAKVTEHFDDSEFRCKCGCNGCIINVPFVGRLEQLRTALNAKSIVISSGYRCPTHSVRVGGSSNDAHVLGFAADVIAYKQDGTPYSSVTVAKEAEKIGFGGIGLIDNNYVHVDSRDCNKYANSHWFGDERTGNNNIPTFLTMDSEPVQGAPEPMKHTLTVSIDGKTVYETKI